MYLPRAIHYINTQKCGQPPPKPNYNIPSNKRKSVQCKMRNAPIAKHSGLELTARVERSPEQIVPRYLATNTIVNKIQTELCLAGSDPEGMRSGAEGSTEKNTADHSRSTTVRQRNRLELCVSFSVRVRVCVCVCSMCVCVCVWYGMQNQANICTVEPRLAKTSDKRVEYSFVYCKTSSEQL